MKKTRLIFDGFFLIISSFLLSFCIFKLINTPKTVALSVSFILAICIFIAYFIKSYDLSNNLNYSLKERKKIESLKNKLCAMNNSEIIDLFENILQNFKKTGNFLESENQIIICNFLPENLSVNEGLSLVKTVNSDKQILYFSNGFSPNLSHILSNLKIKTFEIESVYELIKEKKPRFIDNLQTTKNKNIISPENFFAKRNGVKFIVYGIIFLLFSFITFFPVYNVISGGIFIIYGAITLLFGKSNKKPTSVSIIDTLQN